MLNFDSFREKFHLYRIDNHLTQEEFSELLDISAKTVLRIENGTTKPPTKVIVNFLNLLCLNTENLEVHDDINSNKDLYIGSIREKTNRMDSKERKLLSETIKLFLSKGN
ncbi:helix-turn-helix domain-containing protein [Tyzzerella sp. OttesenSCG-928-J15]|nr:helix-turn-helix domain-containing protein [Tyzzerella sp. OttesenSCG-928-J15]